jgi:hypothetical protein
VEESSNAVKKWTKQERSTRRAKRQVMQGYMAMNPPAPTLASMTHQSLKKEASTMEQ